ncbi:MAG: outer membrane protein assembly factor BamD [Deltaproteobacteria bacterium]
MMKKLASLLVVVFAVVAVSSCGGGKKLTTGKESPEQLYQIAIKELSKKEGRIGFLSGTDYERIFAVLRDIQLKYTYSSYATLAELRAADAYFKKEEYEQAAIEYEAFLSRHPNHKEASYATYRLAVSHYNLRRDYDRDPTSTREAINRFTAYLDKFPAAPEAEEVKKKIVECRNILAKREVTIGRYYASRDNPKAAAERFRGVVTNYPDTKVFEESLFLMGKFYFEAEQFSPAREALTRVVDEFPRTKYRSEASDLLSKIEKKERDSTN